MSDSLFPSGPWTGFYNYRPGDRHLMEMHLTFSNGVLVGDGKDDIGVFTIKGRYDAGTRECYWTKSYVGAHDVYYKGFREGKGIWGTWEIRIWAHGGFHIWPRDAGAGEQESETAEATEPVDAIGTEAQEELTSHSAKGQRGSSMALRGARESRLILDHPISHQDQTASGPQYQHQVRRQEVLRRQVYRASVCCGVQSSDS